jgi:short subunit dehydrogenase-like uncharacterized protein
VTSRAEFDIVVLGATGATGREVVRYMAERAPQAGVSWAVAGRDVDRCRATLAASAATEVPVLDLDVTDRAAVERVVDSAGVVANLVGPYARFGRHVYDVCAATGTDQVDVCGEIDWLAEQVPDVHDVAQQTGSRIVTACGFESLPFDLVNLALAREASARWGEPLASNEVAIAVNPDPPVVRLHDIVSGGTLRSGAEALRRGAGSSMADVRVLDPRPHDATPLDLQPWRHPVDGRWLGPLLPTPYINPAIVYRTVGLLAGDDSWFAEDFRYRDGLAAERLVPGVPAPLIAAWLSGLQVLSGFLGSRPSAIGNAVAAGFEAFGPRPGEAPSEAHLAGWTWRLDAVGTTAGGNRCRAAVAGSGHPGYRSTARLVAEAALVLATTEPGAAGGVLTPAVAFAATNLDHWRRAGCEFLIE